MKKILSIMLALVLCVSMVALVGCQPKPEPKTAEGLLRTALGHYEKILQDNKALSIINQSMNGGSIGLNVKTPEVENNSGITTVGGTEATNINLTMYPDKTNNKFSLVFGVQQGELDMNAQLGVNGTQLVIGSSILDEAYGIDLKTMKEKFPTSIFGTQGLNLLELTEEDETELLNAIDEALNKSTTINDVDVYNLFIDSLVKYGDLTLTEKTPALVYGETVESDLVTVTLTKGDLKAIAKDMVDAFGMQESLDELFKQYNEMAEEEQQFANLDAVIDELLKDYTNDAVVVDIKMNLDMKHSAIMYADVKIGANMYMMITVGANPAKAEKVTIAMHTDEGSDTMVINIKDDAAEYKLEFVDEEGKNGGAIVVDRAHQTLALYSIEDGQRNEEFKLKYNLTDDKLDLIFDYEGVDMTLTFKSKDTSPVKFDNYTDVLDMTMEEMEELVAKLQEQFPSDDYDDDLDDDGWYGDEDWYDEDGLPMN